MKDSNFKSGRWGKSWDEVFSNSAQIGTANLTGGNLTLDIPCGKLLDFPGIVINGKKPLCKADFIYGYTQESYYILLHDASHSKGSGHIPGMCSETIHARELFASKESRPDITKAITKAKVDYLGLTEWYRRSGFTLKLNSEAYSFESLSFNKDDDQPLTIFQNENLVLTIISENTFPDFDISEMVFRHKNYLLFEFRPGKTIEETLSLIDRMSSFLSLCMGFKSDIQSIRFTFEDGASDVQYYSEQREAPKPSPNVFHTMPFPFHVIQSEIFSYLEKWIASETSEDFDAFPYLQYASELLISVLMCKWEMPIQPLYITASQALESLSKYEATKSDALHALQKDLYSEYMRKLKTLLDGTEKAFRDWVNRHFHGNDKGLGRLISELIEKKSDVFETILLDVDSFIKLQKKYRNQYTHPSPDCSNNYLELWHMTQCICLISSALVWNYLGMPSSFIARRFEQSCYKAEIIRWAQERFPERKAEE